MKKCLRKSAGTENIQLFCSLAGVAVPLKGTALALGAAGCAGIPAKQHHPVAEVAGFLWWNDLPQLSFHLQGIFGAVGNAKPSRDADTVGITDIALLAEDVA